MQIRMRYKLNEKADWITYPITPQTYFEPREATSYEWDDVPLHLHAVDYLPVPAASVESTYVSIRQPQHTLRLTIIETLWNAGRNVIIQRFENDFELLIVQILVEEPPATWHTIRLSREANVRWMLEHLQTIETPLGQILGPSEVLSIPVDERFFEQLPQLAPQEIRWNKGQNSIVYQGDPTHTYLELKLQIRYQPMIMHTISLLRNEDKPGLLEHYITAGDVRTTIIRRQL